MKAYKKIIDETLIQYFDEMLEDKKNIFAKKTIEAMKYTTCLNGKRLRAIMCLESCRLISKNYLNAIPSACAIEMLHSQSLIHDDLPSMDNDELRRGKPANHIIYGESTAILAGDALISLGAQIILDKTSKDVSFASVLETLREYLIAAGIFGIVGGQTADIEAENLSSIYRNDEKFLEYIQQFKTGTLFRASCAIGAIIGGSNSDKLNCLKNFGENFGIAFQMADDILDIIATKEEMGKSTGKDEKENKLTFINKYGIECAKEKLKLQIDKTYGILKNGNIESDIFNEIIDSILNKIF